jgi:glycosyl transferase family 25
MRRRRKVKAYIITLKGNIKSEEAAQRCKKSANIPIETFDAVTDQSAIKLTLNYAIKWNYPWKGEEYDLKAGLKKTSYPTKEPLKRVACFLSHYTLWKKCITLDEPVLILEHDAIFIKPLDYQYILDDKCEIVGINDPRGATRKAQVFHEKIQQKPQRIQITPTIDDPTIPQGIAGNSAYIIKPSGAKKMLDLVKEYGAWPNDALMCKQLVQGLCVTREYYTKVQGLESTTSW